jgi:hypothetical protein
MSNIIIVQVILESTEAVMDGNIRKGSEIEKQGGRVMKAAITFNLILLAIILSIGLAVHESGARVATVESGQQQYDGLVTGIYEGYQNQTINMLLQDGSRRAYPFKADKSLLRRISKTPLSTRVRISVVNGFVVRFEEVSR